MDDLTKKSVIVQELGAVGLPASQPLTQAALYNALDNKSGAGGFDRGVGDQLLKKLQATNSVLTPATFADVWLEAEKKVLDKIAASQANLEKIQARMQANETNYAQAANMPQQHQKTLIFRVVEAKGFSTGPQTNFEVSVRDKSSGLVSLAQFAREKFAIHVEERDTVAVILVNPTPDLRSCEGRTEVPLLAFHDKLMHEKEFFVPLMQGGEGRLKVQFQLVHGPLEYYQSLARGYEEAAIENQETSASFRDMLEAMYRPFQGLTSEKNRLLAVTRPADSVLGGGSKPSRPFATDLSSVGPGFQSYNPYNTQNRSYFGSGNTSPSQLMKPELRESPGYVEPQARGLPQELSAFSTKTDYRQYHVFVHYLYYFMILVALLALIVCLYRPAFIGLAASVSYLAWYFVKEDSRIQIKFMFYAVLLVIALVIDAVWLAYYTDPYWKEQYIDSNSLWVLRRTAVIVSYLLVAAEAGACFFAVALGANEPLITRRI